MGQFVYDARCRYCSSRNVWTSRVRLGDLLYFVLFNKRPLRCRSCKRRFFHKANACFDLGLFGRSSEQIPTSPSTDLES